MIFREKVTPQDCPLPAQLDWMVGLDAFEIFKRLKTIVPCQKMANLAAKIEGSECAMACYTKNQTVPPKEPFAQLIRDWGTRPSSAVYHAGFSFAGRFFFAILRVDWDEIVDCPEFPRFLC